MVQALRHMAIVSAHTTAMLTPLTGGVSSEIYRVDLPTGPVCVKRALAKLKVAADWRAPVERNRWEVEWMRVAGGIVPEAVPAILGEDRATGCFAMAYLAAGHAPRLEGSASGRPRRRRNGGGHRRRARPDSRRDGGPSRHRGEVSDRRHLPRDPTGALSRRHGARAPGPRGSLRRARRDNAHQQARAGPRRFQPEESVASGRRVR